MNKNWIYGRKVVLSGCSAGIGKSLCDLLITKYGCSVMGIARNKATLEAMKIKYGSYFDYQIFDISNEQAWKDFSQQLSNIGFEADIVINNAGMIQPFGQFNDMTKEQVDKVVNTNLYSVLYSCKAFIPMVKKSDFGMIMNVSSASAILPFGGESVYTATKAAVWGLSESLAQELRGFGVCVSCVMPGPVKTDLYKARGDEVSAKASPKVSNIGISSDVAAKRIIKALRKRKTRVLIDLVAKFMDFSMRIFPTITCRFVGYFMKKSCKYMDSFRVIYQEQILNEAELKQKLKNRKHKILKSLNEVEKTGFFNINDK